MTLCNAPILSVSALNQHVRQALETDFSSVWVEGEVSNLSRPSSGHLYFTLKDDKAQVRCAFFRAQQTRLNFALENGLQVVVQAKVSLYPERGDYQLLIQKMHASGEGLLRQAYEALLKKLAQKGLFVPEHKKPLPFLPRHVGIITSPTGAVIHDLLTILKERFPALRVTLYPSQVQGAQAANDLLRALNLAVQHAECDVLVLARGGGSLEDLWAFNDERLAHAIYACPLPIISAIGHEVDFTIADFVADQRAATPSHAAKLLVPEQAVLRQQIQQWAKRLHQHLVHLLQQYQQHLDHLTQRLRDPQKYIQILLQTVTALQARLHTHMAHQLSLQRLGLQACYRSLHQLSPLATLERGYAIVTEAHSKRLIRHIHEVKPGMQLCVQLVDGVIPCQAEDNH